MLNLFYGEPDDDRWLPFDRYPRQIVRRLIRGPPRPGGQTRVFMNLCAGLDRLGVEYRVNDYAYARRHPDELACIVGKPLLLDRVQWRNPILFGAAVFSHPLDDPNLLQRLPVRRILVPGEWMRRMFESYWGDAVSAWPVGIDTDLWRPAAAAEKDVDVLLYDKVRWDRDLYQKSLIDPIRETMEKSGRSVLELRYEAYREEEFHVALRRCRAMVFLCEHETQGIAYQQALACGIPIFAWDRQGPWQDRSYFPHQVVFEPVTSVPYWDRRCGETFRDVAEFDRGWAAFWEKARSAIFQPRDYILENLTLEQCAGRYIRLAELAELGRRVRYNGRTEGFGSNPVL